MATYSAMDKSSHSAPQVTGIAVFSRRGFVVNFPFAPGFEFKVEIIAQARFAVFC
jgi:hypothetical protein